MHQILSIFPVDFLLIREKNQTLQLLVGSCPSMGSGFFSMKFYYFFQKHLGLPAGTERPLSLHLVEGRMSSYGENNEGHILGVTDTPLYTVYSRIATLLENTFSHFAIHIFRCNKTILQF